MANALAFIDFRIWGGGINPLPYNWRNDGALVYAGVYYGTLYFAGIHMGPFVTTKPTFTNAVISHQKSTNL